MRITARHRAHRRLAPVGYPNRRLKMQHLAILSQARWTTRCPRTQQFATPLKVRCTSALPPSFRAALLTNPKRRRGTASENTLIVTVLAFRFECNFVTPSSTPTTRAHALLAGRPKMQHCATPVVGASRSRDAECAG